MYLHCYTVYRLQVFNGASPRRRPRPRSLILVASRLLRRQSYPSSRSVCCTVSAKPSSFLLYFDYLQVDEALSRHETMTGLVKAMVICHIFRTRWQFSAGEDMIREMGESVEPPQAYTWSAYCCACTSSSNQIYTSRCPRTG